MVPVSRNVCNSLLTQRFVERFSGNSSVGLFAVYPNTNFLSKSCLRRWIRCWLLTNTAVASAVTNFRCHKLIAICNKITVTKFFCNEYGERHHIFKHQKYQNLWTNNKVRGECNMLALSSISAEYLQKFEFLVSQGIVATYLWWGGRCHMGFVPNFICFPAVQKFWESVKIWQSYR